MRKLAIIITLLFVIVSGCGSNKLAFTIEKAPDYKNDAASEFIVKITKDDEVITGLTITATLEMSKMDHGVIEVAFEDNGDGTYTGEVELPMAGEWIADIKAEKDGKTNEGVLTFDVKER